MHDDVYSNINDYNPDIKRKILSVFQDMIADIMTNKQFQTIIKELHIKCRKLNISPVFITQSYFSVPKKVALRINESQQKELQQILLIIQQIFIIKML